MSTQERKHIGSLVTYYAMVLLTVTAWGHPLRWLHYPLWLSLPLAAFVLVAVPWLLAQTLELISTGPDA